MKKVVIGIFSVAFIFGAGTYTFAQSNGDGGGLLNFGQMKPHIEKMHPNLSTKEQKKIFEDCHGSDGMMQGSDSQSMHPENTMNNL